MEHIRFSDKTKQKIFERDEHKCVMCGIGKKEGEYINAWYIKPKYKGGKATVQNGLTFCPKHFFMAQMYGCVDMAMFEFAGILPKMQTTARQENETEMIDFLEDVLAVYEKHNINGHIVWKK